MKNLKGLFFLAFFAVGFLPASQLAATDDQTALVAAKRAELNDHEWEIKLTPTSGKDSPATDTLVFKNQMFESKKMGTKGYKPTNYTLTLQQGGPTIWETMQSLEDGKVVFWRGEWQDTSMKGVMSKQLGEGKNEDYYFSSLSSKAIEKPAEPAKETAQETAAGPQTATPAVTAETKDTKAAAGAQKAKAQKPKKKN